MKDEEAGQVSINHCVRDSEIAEIEAMLEAADRGAWRYVEGQLERYAGPLQRVEASMRLAAASVTIIPRLLKGLRVLEEAYTAACVKAASLRDALCKEREAAEFAAVNRGLERTGPTGELELVVALVMTWAAVPPAQRQFSNYNVAYAVSGFIQRWLGGQSIAEDVKFQHGVMVKELERHIAYELKRSEELDAARAEVLGWVRKLEAGDVPAEMARQWREMTKARRKALLEKAG